jgi:hypothetical protein
MTCRNLLAEGSFRKLELPLGLGSAAILPLRHRHRFTLKRFGFLPRFGARQLVAVIPGAFGKHTIRVRITQDDATAHGDNISRGFHPGLRA